MTLNERCWNCGGFAVWCEFKHFMKPAISGIFEGLIIGGSIGALAALAGNLWTDWL